MHDVAADLLRQVDVSLPAPRLPYQSAGARWATSGAMALTGDPNGPPLCPSAPVALVVDAAVAIADQLAVHLGGVATGTDGAALLGERAALSRLTRGGTASCGGGTRLIECADAWLAVTLAREEDLAGLPAWIGADPGTRDAAWPVLRDRLANLAAVEAVATARLLEIPAAVAGERTATEPWSLTAPGDAAPAKRRVISWPPLVVDLSSLWAGPLCGDLLLRAGAPVVKVEDPNRVDGARRGPRPMFELVNGGKSSVALDLTTRSGRADLRRLVDAADVVITSARPRAFERLEIDPLDVIARGGVWVGITAYGWNGDGRNRTGFGDDAAVAGGLAAVHPENGRLLFCADAVADPLTGALAAAAALTAIAIGGARRVDISLAGAAAYAASFAAAGPSSAARGDEASQWELEDGNSSVVIAAPRARQPAGRVAHLGADTEPILRGLR